MVFKISLFTFIMTIVKFVSTVVHRNICNMCYIRQPEDTGFYVMRINQSKFSLHLNYGTLYVMRWLTVEYRYLNHEAGRVPRSP